MVSISRCEYCRGARCPCTCTSDCGARLTQMNAHPCPHSTQYKLMYGPEPKTEAVSAGSGTPGTPASDNAGESISGPQGGIVHLCPADGGHLMDCCGQTPFEVLRTDRLSLDPDQVTCKGPASEETPAAAPAKVLDGTLLEALRGLKASFVYDRALGCHIPVCSLLRLQPMDGRITACGNGPLAADEFETGSCSDPHVVHVEPPEWYIPRH